MASTPFTGRRAFLVIGGGFAIVIAVNMTMAYLAARSNPGLVVANSYVAGQQFNEMLAEGRAQKQLGWTVATSNQGGMLVVSALNSLGKPIDGLSGAVTISHTLGAEPAQTLPLAPDGQGRYVAGQLPAGQWIVETRIALGGQHFYQKTRLSGG